MSISDSELGVSFVSPENLEDSSYRAEQRNEKKIDRGRERPVGVDWQRGSIGSRPEEENARKKIEQKG